MQKPRSDPCTARCLAQTTASTKSSAEAHTGNQVLPLSHRGSLLRLKGENNLKKTLRNSFYLLSVNTDSEKHPGHEFPACNNKLTDSIPSILFAVVVRMRNLNLFWEVSRPGVFQLQSTQHLTQHLQAHPLQCWGLKEPQPQLCKHVLYLFNHIPVHSTKSDFSSVLGDKTSD